MRIVTDVFSNPPIVPSSLTVGADVVGTDVVLGEDVGGGVGGDGGAVQFPVPGHLE